MRGRGHDWSGSVDAGGSPSPVDARRDAADRLVGRRALFALQVVAIITVIIFATCGMLVDPHIGGIESRFLGAAVGAVWALPSVASLVVMIVCRRPACRQVFGLREAITAAAVLGAFAGGMGVAAGFYGAPPVAVVICGVAVVSGLATLVLHYIFRIRRVR